MSRSRYCDESSEARRGCGKAQRIMGVKVIFSRDCSLGHLTDDFAERKFSPTPTVRHLACKGFVYHAPRDARHAA